MANPERRGVVPAGKRLVVIRSGEELRIDLRDAAEGIPTAASTVLATGRVDRYHPVVAGSRALKETNRISRAEFPRVCRILQALVAEAERRGYGVGISAAPEPHQPRSDRSDERGSNLVSTIEGVAVTPKYWSHRLRHGSRATAIRAYCDAIEQRHPGLGAAADWIAWARADHIDPVDPAPTLPGPPTKMTAEDLQPFLDGWSARGPDRSSGRS